jgi:hypothetical protein
MSRITFDPIKHVQVVVTFESGKTVTISAADPWTTDITLPRGFSYYSLPLEDLAEPGNLTYFELREAELTVKLRTNPRSNDNDDLIKMEIT